MSVIAWKDGVLAVDSRIDNNEIVFDGMKIVNDGDVLMAIAGIIADGGAMMNWFREGAIPDNFPKPYGSDNLQCDLITVTRDSLRLYHSAPYPNIYDRDKPMAWGSGAQFAYAAMACGKSAVEAVKIACQVHPHCGLPVKAFSLGSVEVVDTPPEYDIVFSKLTSGLWLAQDRISGKRFKAVDKIEAECKLINQINHEKATSLDKVAPSNVAYREITDVTPHVWQAHDGRTGTLAQGTSREHAYEVLCKELNK